MPNELNDLSLNITESMLVDHYYNSLKGLFIHNLSLPNKSGLVLDLDSLPAKPPGLKQAVIRWLISVNLTRIKNGEEPIITIEVVLKCPVWKIVSPPIRRIKLTKEDLLNSPAPKTINKKSKMGSINKGK